eukprot:2862138-Rhodomonas_salina.1
MGPLDSLAESESPPQAGLSQGGTPMIWRYLRGPEPEGPVQSGVAGVTVVIAAVRDAVFDVDSCLLECMRGWRTMSRPGPECDLCLGGRGRLWAQVGGL